MSWLKKNRIAVLKVVFLFAIAIQMIFVPPLGPVNAGYWVILVPVVFWIVGTFLILSLHQIKVDTKPYWNNRIFGKDSILGSLHFFSWMLITVGVLSVSITFLKSQKLDAIGWMSLGCGLGIRIGMWLYLRVFSAAR
ncbi:MAG: hypothetical protein AAF193_12480 [Bacteroidota bacterium]